jgi:pimeloyl-ACP methyl ester carboxylesterase
MPFIAARDGTQLYLREWGQGAPLLFLNSLGCGSQMWDYQTPYPHKAGHFRTRGPLIIPRNCRHFADCPLVS